MVRVAERKPKFINPFHYFKLDTDGDGVVDWKDCRPFDRTRQHIGKSELEASPDVRKQVSIKAVRLYPSFSQMAIVVTGAIKRFFLHPQQEQVAKAFEHDFELLLSRKLPFKKNPLQVSWYDTKDYLLDVFDPLYDVHHYAYMVGKKTVAHPGEPVILVSITSLDREKMGQKEFNKMLRKARDYVKEQYEKREEYYG